MKFVILLATIDVVVVAIAVVVVNNVGIGKYGLTESICQG